MCMAGRTVFDLTVPRRIARCTWGRWNVMPHEGSNGKKKNEERHKDVILTRGEGIVARRENKGTQGEEDAEKAV